MTLRTVECLSVLSKTLKLSCKPFKKKIKNSAARLAKCKLYTPFYKNAQGLASGTRRIRNQHSRFDPKSLKNVVYVSEHNSVLCSLDFLKYLDQNKQCIVDTDASTRGQRGRTPSGLCKPIS